MTVINANRAAFDAALLNPRLDFLVLGPSDDDTAKAVHGVAKETFVDDGTDWRVVFLFSDLGVLTAEELKAWFDGSRGRYAVLGSPEHEVSKDPRGKGEQKSLFLVNGEPSTVEIRYVMSTCPHIPV